MAEGDLYKGKEVDLLRLDNSGVLSISNEGKRGSESHGGGKKSASRLITACYLKAKGRKDLRRRTDILLAPRRGWPVMLVAY